ncbi:MAG: hypothetical protein JHC33_05345 [Ignisphaera sp.]|nr:hypothetical protein [Ignisphaera sp.]
MTKKYIRDALEHHYSGMSYKFSQDLIDILYADYLRKKENLRWLFGDEDRIFINPSDDAIYDALFASEELRVFFDLAVDILGSKLPKDLLLKGLIDVGKQQVKLSKAWDMIKESKNMPRAENKKYYSSTIIKAPSKYRVTKERKESKQFTNEGTYNWFKLGNCLVIASLEDAVYTLVTDFNTQRVSDQIQGNPVLLSLDINDYITCSSGSVSSCMSMGNSYHLGWMMHFRSDFSIMSFVHKKGDVHYKIGRSWLYLKLTEDGLVYPRPFYKISKRYGDLTRTHCSSIDSYIQEKARSLGFSYPTKRQDVTGWGNADSKYAVSMNMRNVSSFFSTNSGYFDWHIDEVTPIWEYPGDYKVVPFTAEVYKNGPVCLLNFPHALDVNGKPTVAGNFNDRISSDSRTLVGWAEKFPRFVECKFSGNRILLQDAIKIGDEYADKRIVADMLLGNTTKVVVEQEEVVESKVYLYLDDSDMGDF